jgi:hypothetical protein
MFEDTVKKLFDDAMSKSGLDYIYTLLRVGPIKLNRLDPMLQLRADLERIGGEPPDEQLLASYCLLASNDEPLKLLANLLNCAQARNYDAFPFLHLRKGEFPGQIIEPTPLELARELSGWAERAERPEIVRVLDGAYPAEILHACESQTTPSLERIKAAFHNCYSLLSALLNAYFEERLKFREVPRFQRAPSNMIVEFLTDEEFGLYGFQMHFPNGATSSFVRSADSALGTNIRIAPRVTFFIGVIDDPPQEWLVGGRRLHELGLEGRYNEPGEWKPIVYPVISDKLIHEAQAASTDRDVQGALFYVLSTGYRVIEFVVRTAIDLPTEGCSFGTQFHLWKCPPLDPDSPVDRNIRIYDCWFDLESIDPEYIRDAIAMIGISVNRMAFAFEAGTTWRVKYRLMEGGGSLAAPTEEDTHVLDSLLRNFPESDDAIILDAAVDWYNRGKASTNVFTAFLCYYIAIESVATAVADGKADFGLGYHKESKPERIKRVRGCIQEKLESLYSDNPEEFVKEAYFHCVIGLARKTRQVVELVFGQGHPYLRTLFARGDDGFSLSDIRSKLAHGAISLIDKEHETLVANRLHEIAEISKVFLTRIIFLLKPGDPMPAWSRRFKAPRHFADPRSTMIITNEMGLPTTDWRIRPQWCE